MRASAHVLAAHRRTEEPGARDTKCLKGACPPRELGLINVNSGYSMGLVAPGSANTNTRYKHTVRPPYILVYRIEEAHKVMVHELVHYWGYDKQLYDGRLDASIARVQREQQHANNKLRRAGPVRGAATVHRETGHQGPATAGHHVRARHHMLKRYPNIVRAMLYPIFTQALDAALGSVTTCCASLRMNVL